MDIRYVYDSIHDGKDEILDKIYKKYRNDFIHWAMQRYNISEHDAKDVFQFSVIKLYENIVNRRINEFKASVKTYVFAIAKNKISEIRKRNAKWVFQADELIKDDLYELLDWHAEENYKNDLINRLNEVLNRLGKPCSEILKLFYYHNQSLHQMAEILSYKNVDSVKTQKYKCLSRLRKMFDNEIKGE
ncbi:MAG: sigma-70 family RNA polymerase sigma factor [Cyclobacteriaceae bacterium]|nr:sigma-70 family RNA polymerase sigma factor [Cyclobacteriaceae bacterium]